MKRSNDMIPSRATPEEIEQYASNIRSAWDDCTPGQLERGRAWYPTAHQIAGIIGAGDIAMGAGIIAALSANKRWEDNLRLAQDASSGHIHGHTGVTLKKVRKILDGADPAMVLPMSLKTGSFYRCILDPDDPDPVVIDRHSHDVATGEINGNKDRGLSSVHRYAGLAHACRIAARDLGVITSVLQASTWVRQVEMLDGVGTRIRRNH